MTTGQEDRQGIITIRQGIITIRQGIITIRPDTTEMTVGDQGRPKRQERRPAN